MDPELQKIVDAENKRNKAERERIARRLEAASPGLRGMVEQRGEVLYDAG